MKFFLSFVLGLIIASPSFALSFDRLQVKKLQGWGDENVFIVDGRTGIPMNEAVADVFLGLEYSSSYVCDVKGIKSHKEGSVRPQAATYWVYQLENCDKE